MTTPWLSQEEVIDLCDGLTQGAAQCRFLKNVLKVPVRRKPNGKPLLMRSAVEGLDAKKAAKVREDRKPVEPDSMGLILAFSRDAR